MAAPPVARAAGGKVIIGAFVDGGLTPFKQKIIPLAKSEAGFDIEFLEDEYGVTLEKWFADAQNNAGQYDMYLLDDPWVRNSAPPTFSRISALAGSMRPIPTGSPR